MPSNSTLLEIYIAGFAYHGSIHLHGSSAWNSYFLYRNKLYMQDMQVVIPGLFVSPRWSPQWETFWYRAMTEGIYKNSGNEVVLLFYEGMTWWYAGRCICQPHARCYCCLLHEPRLNTPLTHGEDMTTYQSNQSALWSRGIVQEWLSLYLDIDYLSVIWQ